MAALYPLAPMAAYERSARTNDPVFVALQAVQDAREPGETVLLDYSTDGVFFMAAGSAYKSMEFLFSTQRRAVRGDRRARRLGSRTRWTGTTSRLVVLNSDKAVRSAATSR